MAAGPAAAGRHAFVHGPGDRWWRYDQVDRVPWNRRGRGRGGSWEIASDVEDGVPFDNWLVVWNINLIFPYIGNNHPN